MWLAHLLNCWLVAALAFAAFDSPDSRNSFMGTFAVVAVVGIESLCFDLANSWMVFAVMDCTNKAPLPHNLF